GRVPDLDRTVGGGVPDSAGEEPPVRAKRAVSAHVIADGDSPKYPAGGRMPHLHCLLQARGEELPAVGTEGHREELLMTLERQNLRSEAGIPDLHLPAPVCRRQAPAVRGE